MASLPPEQMFQLMQQMKLCIQNNPQEARTMLLQNPQLAYALLQAQERGFRHVLFDDSGLPAPGSTDDAVVREDEASYERAAAVSPIEGAVEQAVVAALLGRPSRSRSAVAQRCTHGLPTVLRVDPRLEDGTPFPTVFWLTCPLVRRAVGTLEADQVMAGFNERMDGDEDLQREYAEASQRYVAFRDELGDPLPGDPSAGGMPGHIKCLHTHAGHTLATGDNWVGHATLDHVLPVRCEAPCVDLDTVVQEWGDDGSEVVS